MRCLQCQQENPPGSNFCLGCGTPLGLSCAECGAVLVVGSRFCNKCGKPLQVQASGPRFASPQSYTPPHLAEKILTSRTALEGERKQVTVLFADIKGSMELLADRDPEEARKLLDPVLERMMEAVHRYEGTVNQVMGDGIMALFGAPLAHEDHAVRACYAGLRLQESVKRYAEDVRREHGVSIHVRVGLNSGEVVVRAIGSDLHMDYTAVGQTTHLAARMEQLAHPGSILLTPDTLTLAEGFVQVNPLGPVAVKGMAAPIDVYELAGASAARSRLQASVVRGLTRFMGRDAEMEQLRRALDLALRGRGQAVALVGEAGVGKSRLVYEFIHSHRTKGWLVLEAGAVSYGKATSYWPVLDLLKTYFKITDRDSHRDIREKVTGKLLTLDETLRPTLPAFLGLLDVPVDDSSWANFDRQQRRQHTLDALKRLLFREIQVQPVLIVFEDLHWIDAETQALLDSLVEILPAARLLLVVDYRPEYSHVWGSKSYYTQLRLDALPAETAGELLDVLLGQDPSVGPLKSLLVARTGGNPFFLEESVRTLVETRTLAGESGAYRLMRPPETIQVPTTVQAILAARIDRLPPEEKQLLQSASVVGKDVLFTLLLQIVEEPEELLRERLAHLQTAEFLYETRLFPDLEYTFKHALTHEVAYKSLLQDRRRALHARIVTVMEHVYADRLVEHAERLGDHAMRGEEWDRAIVHLTRAGAKAISAAAYQEAAVHFGRALEALARLPESRHAREQRADLLFHLHDALLPLGEYDRIRDVLAEAEALVTALDDRRRLGRGYSYLSHYAWIAVGDNRRAHEYAHRALALARADAAPSLEIVANFYLGQIGYGRGDLHDAVSALARNIAMLPATSVSGPFDVFYAVLSRGWISHPYSDLGDFAEGLALASEALRIAETTRNPVHLVSAYVGLGRLHLWRGDLRRAVELGQRGRAVEQVDDLGWVPMLAAVLGPALVMMGRVSEGLRLQEEALDLYETRKMKVYKSLHLVHLGEAYLQAGRAADALARASEARDRARRWEERGFEAWALRLLGEIASTSAPDDDGSTGAAYYRQARSLAEELGMRPLAAHCHLGLARLYHRTDQRRDAQEHFTRATTMYRDMGMQFWLEKATAETFS
jgi:class 3 adenylate cyclase/tetratricopeptide (TPR) repeat protein